MGNESIASMPVDQLESRIQQHLLGRVSIRRFRVVVQEQGLILQGCAATYYAKQLAQHAAMKVSGLPIVANDIEVQ